MQTLMLMAATIYAARAKAGASEGDKAEWRRQAMEEALALYRHMKGNDAD
jgi:hypothetical protein